MKRTVTELNKVAHKIVTETPNISLFAMFIEGFRFCELNQFARTKPIHKAEVVKCGMIHTEMGSIPCNVTLKTEGDVTIVLDPRFDYAFTNKINEETAEGAKEAEGTDHLQGGTV